MVNTLNIMFTRAKHDVYETQIWCLQSVCYHFSLEVDLLQHVEHYVLAKK